MFPYQKIIATPIIFNNTGYLILMLGAVGYSPVVSPHRIKQVCKPYQVVKVATEWYSVGSLDHLCMVSWQNCYDTVVFLLVTVMIPLYFCLCYVFSCRERVKRVFGVTGLLLCQNTDGSLCTDIKASVTKRKCQANTRSFPRKKH